MHSPGNNIEQTADTLTRRFEREPIIAGVLARLAGELPPELRYHAPDHTRDVLRETMLFASASGVDDRGCELLAIAAAFHDAGYIESPRDNEPLGARIARAAMEQHARWTPAEIQLVERMILDTRLVTTSTGLQQIPTTPLSPYLLDADLSNFGRDDFLERAELQREELGIERSHFLRKTLDLVLNHRWLTEAARTLRDETKQRNLERLRQILRVGESAGSNLNRAVREERVAILARLPLLLKSAVDTRAVIETVLGYTREALQAEAATVFIREQAGGELTFWALAGGEDSRLTGRRIPADRGIVGWVIERGEAVLVPDAREDPRFFGEIDREGSFVTRNLLCVPLVVRGSTTIGAMQVLNAKEGTFDEEDLLFIEQLCPQVALAIDNARLYEALQGR